MTLPSSNYSALVNTHAALAAPTAWQPLQPWREDPASGSRFVFPAFAAGARFSALRQKHS
jgi:hypothetical protein